MTIRAVIAVYHCERTIRMALDSPLPQTHPAHPILVPCVGSTVRTPSILKSYEPRLAVLKQENNSVSTARPALRGHRVESSYRCGKCEIPTS
jgi:hypothetical protein